MSKEAVHGSYLERMKAEHGGKLVPPIEARSVLVVGSNTERVMVTGEPPNIGYAITDRLRSEGYSVLDPPFCELDVTCDRQLTAVFESFSGIDTMILANGYTAMNWIEDYRSDDMWRVLNHSLYGSMKATSHFVRHTIDSPVHKHIVYIGSMAYSAVLNASAPYCAAKAGLHAFCKCMGWELTPKGYTVTIVHPSNTEGTPMTEKTIKEIMKYRQLPRAEAEAYWASINLKERWLQPADIADAVSYLVSGRAQYMSGQSINLSGGQR